MFGFPKKCTLFHKLLFLKSTISSAVQKTISGAILSIKDALAMPAQSLTVDISPSESGVSSVQIYHRGKNLFDEANATQYTRYISYINGSAAEWKSSSDSRSYAIEVIPGETYTISLNADPQSTIFRVAAITVPPTTAGTIASTHAFSNSGNPVYEISLKMREGEKWLVIQVGKSFADERKAKIQVEAGSTHTEYANYVGEEKTISLGTTLYAGGTLDVTTGELTIGGSTTQLAPTEITLYEGENTLWSDAGDLSMTYLSDGTADNRQALNILLGGRYQNLGAPDEATDAEALNILLGR